MTTYPAPGRHRPVPASTYARALTLAWDRRPEIAESLTDYRDPATVTGQAYLSHDRSSGFVVRDGELVGVFSTRKGAGDVIMRDALDAGAVRLDCFDGYLPAFYARHGFRETHREENWTPGGPDVVYMALDAATVAA